MMSSVVANLIDFEADEFPKWRKSTERVPSVKEMLQEIVKYQSKWERLKHSIDENTHKEAFHHCLKELIYRTSIEEGTGFKSKEDVESCIHKDAASQGSLSKEEQETVNLNNAYLYLLKEISEVEDITESQQLHGLLEINLIKSVHKLILKDIKLSENCSKPGEFSKNVRLTTFEGEEYVYASPTDMDKKVQRAIDRFNDLVSYSVKREKNSQDRVYNMFKSCTWLLFKLLDLHPFCDGNGRLCRLLCSFTLSSMTPFPTPIYNVWSESKKDDYIRALVDARKSEKRHPTSLTTMVIECNYFGWKNFLDFLHVEHSS